MADSQLNVLIIGAGLTGLLLAQALQKAGIRYTVFETEPVREHYRPREWGVSIQWGLPLLEELLPKEKYDRIYETSVDPSYTPKDPGIFPTYHGETGAFIQNIPLVFMYRVRRHKFRALCHEGIEVQYGRTLQEVSYPRDGNVVAKFMDGSTATGNLIVGADGARSKVRQLLFPNPRGLATEVPYIVVGLHVRYGDAEKARFIRQNHPVLCHAIHPNGLWLWISIQETPDPNDPTTWTFQLLMTLRRELAEGPVDLQMVKRWAESFGEPFRSSWLWVPDEIPLSGHAMSSWEPTSWDNQEGRVTLVGDAAHTMTVQRGQGMNNGIDDVYKLSKALRLVANRDRSLAEALDEYQAEVIERGAEEVRLSHKQTQMIHNWRLARDSPLMQREGTFSQEKLANL